MAASVRFLRLQLAADVNALVEKTLVGTFKDFSRQITEPMLSQGRLLEIVADVQQGHSKKLEEMQQQLAEHDERIEVMHEAHRRDYTKLMQAVIGDALPDGGDASDVCFSRPSASSCALGVAEDPLEAKSSCPQLVCSEPSHVHPKVQFQRGRVCIAARCLVDSTAFQALSGLVIAANVAYLALKTEISMAHSLGQSKHDPVPYAGAMGYASYGFEIFYCMELAMKIAVDRAEFFTGPGAQWNVFDFALVSAAVFEQSFAMAFATSDGMSISWMRILKVLKCLKMFRMVRVMRYVRGLRILVEALWACGTVLLWSFVVLGTIIFVFGTIFLEGFCDRLESMSTEEMLTEEQWLAQVARWWGSYSSAAVTLFAAVTGGVEWQDVARPLLDIGRGYYLLFLIYIFVMFIAVFNVVTGMFMDSAMKVAIQDHDAMVEMVLKHETNIVERLKEAFASIDMDNDGTISFAELEKSIKDKRVKAYFTAADISTNDAKKIFKIIACGAGNKVGIDEFLDGCMRCKGVAKSVDIVSLSAESRRAMDELKALVTVSRDLLEDLRFSAEKRGGLQRKFGSVGPYQAPAKLGLRRAPSVIPAQGRQASAHTAQETSML